MANKKSKPNILLTFVLCVIFMVGGFVGGGYGYLLYISKAEIAEIQVFTSGEMSFHFLELGNKYTGDCTFIKAGDVDILIDAGSRTDSIPTITEYINNYIDDNTIEYVIVTHAHQDHYAGFATNATTNSIFDLYSIGTIIDFAQTNQSGTMYNHYLRERSEAIERGAKHYTAKECVDNTNGAKSTFDFGNDMSLKILDQKYYHQKDSGTHENNHSVCTLFTQGNKNILLTGDLESKGEESLVTLNNLPHCVLYKAGHHGSKTSSSDALLNVITPEICAVCCCAGNYEYTSSNEDKNEANLNNFPTQDFINRISKHTDKVFVTTLGIPTYVVEDDKWKNDSFVSMNGNIVVKIKNEDVSVQCSNNNTLLKDTNWFKTNRTCPSEWRVAG